MNEDKEDSQYIYIYIYLAISLGMEKRKIRRIYIFHRAKLSNLDVNGVFSTPAHTSHRRLQFDRRRLAGGSLTFYGALWTP